MDDYHQEIFVDLKNGVDGFPLASEELASHEGIELVLEVCLFDVWIGMHVWVLGCGEDEEVMLESDKKGLDVFGLNDLLNLIRGEGIGVDPDELVSVERILSDSQVQEEHPIVSKQRSDCIFCL